MFLENVGSLREYAADFAARLRPPACVALHGDLGAGKTEFARAVIRKLAGADTIVPSPTFTLVQEYGIRDPGPGAQNPSRIFHFDLYRVKSGSELEEIGFFDALADGITIIEWPEIAADFLPENTIHVRLSISGPGREISFTAL
jgi:tRNA threonylcarbamoyl adenosine modification protein YjeE